MAWEIERLSESGFDEVIFFELTKPGEDFAVVRAVIPGLEIGEKETAPGPRTRMRLETRQ